jgi:tRNA (guanine37-N1)-methyltransferase
MRIDILTLFPEMFQCLLVPGIFGRALEGGLVKLKAHNIRDYTHDKHHVVDDYAYGGGAGMILKPEPIFEAVEAVKAHIYKEEPGWDKFVEMPVILLTPQGRPFSQQIADELSKHAGMLLICGRYEGVDERVRQRLVTDEISIGDYVLSGGELAAMVLVDAVVRLLPGFSAQRTRLRMILIPPDCWSTPSILVRWSTGARWCRKCCFPETTPK